MSNDYSGGNGTNRGLVTTMETTGPTLFERLGGAPAIAAVTDELCRRIIDDPELAPFFTRVDVELHARRLGTFITMVTGGPANYRGRDMATAHRRLSIEGRHFDAVAGHLIATLDSVGADPDAADQLLTMVARLRNDIVTVKPAAVATRALNATTHG